MSNLPRPTNLTILTLDEPDVADFAASRNRLLKTAKTEWVLFLDTDETVSPELHKAIVKVCAGSGTPAAYRLRRRTHFLGRVLKYGETGHARFVRLARRDWGTWQRPVHEVWVGEGQLGTLPGYIDHAEPTLTEFVAKINRYSELEATYRHELGRRASLLHVALYPLGKFVWNYLFRLGFLDGIPGVIMAFLMSFHSYLTWTKLYLLGQSQVSHD